MKSIIFDLNGTIIFDEEILKNSWNSFIKAKLGREITALEFENFILGVDEDDTLEYFFGKDITKTQLKDLKNEHSNQYKSLCLQNENNKLAPGLENYLNYLKNVGAKITLATSANSEYIDFFFKTLKLEQWFDKNKISFSDGTVRGKPEPDLYLKALDLLQETPDNCLVFEAGFKAARAANINNIVGVSSNDNLEEIKNLGILTIINNYNDFNLLKKLSK